MGRTEEAKLTVHLWVSTIILVHFTSDENVLSFYLTWVQIENSFSQVFEKNLRG